MNALLARRGFRRLLISQTVSSLGDWLGTVALIALVLDLTGSSTAVGGILVLRLAPSFVAGPLVTKLAGRWNRRGTMLAMDALRCGVVAVIPFVGALWWVYVWAFVLEAASLVFLPARDASVPQLVPEDDRPLANGLVLASSYATLPIGAALFGLAGVLGPSGWDTTIAFAVDAATFAASYVILRPIRALDSPGEVAADPSAKFSRVFRIPLVRAFTPATFVATLGLGSLFSIGIVFVRHVLSASTGEFGVLIALFGVGAAAGLVLVGVVRTDPLHLVRAGIAAQGAVIASMSLSPSLTFVFLGAALFGTATSTTLTSAMSALQDLLPERERVMGFAAFHIVIRVGLSVSAIGAGIANDVVAGVRWPVVGNLPPARVVLLGSGLVVLGAAALIAPQLRRERFAVPSGGGPVVAVQEQAGDERGQRPRPERCVAREALDQHRDDDRGAGERGVRPSGPAEHRDEEDVGDETAERGLPRDASRDEAAEEQRGTGPSLRQQRAERR